MHSARLAAGVIEVVEVFPWNKNFETGIARIDKQHKRLVQLLNLLASHLAYQSDMPTLNNIFNELAEYAAYHFEMEEQVWHRYIPGDAWEAQHRAVHSSFVSAVFKLKEEENVKPLHKVVEDILSFLTHWLAFHILESDKRMAKVVLAVQSGLPVDQAKELAEKEMSGALKVLIETILTMYDNLSARTLQLMREVIERQKAEAKLRLAANVFSTTLDAICITDPAVVVIEANPAFFQATQYAEDEVLGKNLKELKSGLEDEKVSSAIWKTVLEKGHWSGEIHSRAKSGEVEAEWLTLSSIKDEEGAVSNYVGVFSNVAYLIKRQRKLERMAHHDALTGLPNRLLLSDRLELAMARAERSQDYLAVCYLDLDGFKPVNDRLGHAAGDCLLREIARRLKESVRGNDTVARLGGDEFVLLFTELHKPHDFMGFLDRVLHEVERPVQIDNEAASVTVTASVGITLFPSDDGDPATLLHHADTAMYQAKRAGKGCYRIYSSV